MECAGLGAVTPSIPAGSIARDGTFVAGQVQARIGGTSATVVSAALKAGPVGVYVLHIIVPADAPPGGSVPLEIRVGERVSAMVSIAIQ